MRLFGIWFCGHPGDRVLVEFLDGELHLKNAGRVVRHLAVCAKCSERAVRFRNSRECFEQYRNEQLEQLGGPPSEFAAFRTKLAVQSGETRRSEAERAARRAAIHQALRQWTTAATSVATLFLVGWMLWRPAATVSATEVLRRAVQQESRQLGDVRNPVVHQRITVRSKGRAAQWELWRADAVRQEHAEWSEDAVAQELTGVYEANHMDVKRPLSAEDYVGWRDSLAAKTDAVTRLKEGRLLQVTTAVAHPEPGQIEHVDLLVREEDWHPVSESIYVHAANGGQLLYSIEETSYAVIPIDALPLRIFHPEEDATPLHTESVESAQGALRLPSDAQLLASEVRVDEALHELGADVEEAPEVRKANGQVEVSVWLPEGERRDQILSAVKGIPFVTARDAAAASMRLTLPRAAVRPVYATRPPLAKALAKYAGSDSEAANTISALNDAERCVYAETAALERLEASYPEERRRTLPPELQRAIAQMANDHARAIERGGREYLNLLSPVIEAMVSQENPPAAQQRNTDEAASKQAAAAQLRSDLGRLQLLVNRAFLEDHADEPQTELSAGDILSQIIQLRTRAENQMMRVHALYSPTTN